MRVNLKAALSDAHLDANQPQNQRQLHLSLGAQAQAGASSLPLNLGLVLDHSGSMQGKPLETVKKAAIRLVEGLSPSDRLSIIAFDHRAKVIVENQSAADISSISKEIEKLQPEGGTCIDEGMKLGIKEVAQGREERVSQIFLLTDGENEHGDNNRCLKLSQLAAEYNITLNTLGFGNHWNQDVLEKIADTAGGTLRYIEQPEEALTAFTQLFTRLQAVGLTNSYLCLELIPAVRLAELKPLAQVAPETIELNPVKEGESFVIRLGDLMVDQERAILANLYLNDLPAGEQTIARVKVRYDDPSLGKTGLYSETLPITITVQNTYQAQPNPEVQKSILTLAKYRQTQIAEEKLKQGDRLGAATMLQTAANTALKLGEKKAATVLQTNATRLQSGEELSEAERKKTRIVAKTRLQDE